VLQNLLRRSEFIALFLGLREPEQGAIELTQRRVYVLPTGYGLTFAFALALMLVGSINYTLGLGYVLTFSLAGMGLVSLLHTYRNLAHVVVRPGRVAPVFAGGTARFELLLENRSGHDRFAIVVSCESATVETDLPAHALEPVALSLPATRRGLLPLGRVTLESRYPLGLFRCWSYVVPDATAIVYPQPDEAPLPPRKVRNARGEATSAEAGTDDYAGLRQYQPGDSPRHIAWKAVEREGVLLTKQFSGRGLVELTLDWDDLPRDLDVEQKLSRLARWVLAAHDANLAYALRLPGNTTATSLGEGHREQCLTQLALFDAAAARA
jgi:uncharacterized protein (DUF58 family)